MASKLADEITDRICEELRLFEHRQVGWYTQVIYTLGLIRKFMRRRAPIDPCEGVLFSLTSPPSPLSSIPPQGIGVEGAVRGARDVPHACPPASHVQVGRARAGRRAPHPTGLTARARAALVDCIKRAMVERKGVGEESYFKLRIILCSHVLLS